MNLVPRAVSYGVALVDHFFRGRLEVAAVGDRLTVRNPTKLTFDGTATVYADAADGTRRPVGGFEGLPVFLPPGGATTWSGFALPASPVGRYLLVFEGEVEAAPGSGAMDAAVAGRSFPWAPEPPPLPGLIPVGHTPHGLALTPDGGTLYVVNKGANTVSVIDTATRTVTHTVTVGSGPMDVAVADTPVGTRAFVSNEFRASVTVLRTDTSEVVATIAVPNWPEDLAVGADGFVYVAHWSNTPLSRIDPDSLDVTALTGPQRPCQGIAAHPVEAEAYVAYVANLDGNSVSVIDAASRAVVNTLPAGAGTCDSAVSPDGGTLYVANAFDDTVSVIALNAPAPSLVAAFGATLAGGPEAELATVVLEGLPPEARAYADGALPRREQWEEGGRVLSVVPGTAELLLACPGYVPRTLAVELVAGDSVVLDAALWPE